MGFYITDAIGCYACPRMRRADYFRLPLDTRSSKSNLYRTIVVHRGTEYNAVNRIAVSNSLRQTFQHDERKAITYDRSLGFRIESAAVPVRREDSPLLIQVAFFIRHGDRRAARQRNIAFMSEQTLAGNVNSSQRRGTRGLNADARPFEVELVRRARRQRPETVADNDLLQDA